jgi:hypothetical protein
LYIVLTGLPTLFGVQPRSSVTDSESPLAVPGVGVQFSEEKRDGVCVEFLKRERDAREKEREREGVVAWGA